MEERIQIKFSNPDIDGTPQPQLITLEQETPIEGTSERENGESFVWHKWLCTNNQYFMASGSLDGMLKLIPNKTGKPLKIEKVLNSKPDGYPFFQINGMNKDDVVKQAANQMPPMDAIDPLAGQPTTMPASNTDGALVRFEQKLDQIIGALNKIIPAEQKVVSKLEEELPF